MANDFWLAARLAVMETTDFEGRAVPIKPGPRSTIRFSEGAGAEAGDWEFWTAFRDAGPKRIFGVEAGSDAAATRLAMAAEERARWGLL